MGQAEDAIAFARAQIGKPYVFGTAGPDTYDCSGLTMAAYAHANPPIKLVHWTGTQITTGKAVARNELLPGDLVFPDGINHVQLYSGNGQIIEAQQSGVPVREGPMWGFTTARRVVADGSNGGDILDAAGNLIKALPNPLAPAASIVDVFRPFGVLTSTITKGAFWQRAGATFLGGAMVLIGLLYWNRRTIGAITGAVGSAIGSTVSTAVQGAAFGVGTGGTIGRSTGTATVRGTPRAPASAMPRTAPMPREIEPITAKPVSPYRTEAKVNTGRTYHGRPTMIGVGKAPAPPRKLPGEGTMSGGKHRKRASKGGKIL